MNEKQVNICSELEYICRTEYDNDKEKMMYDIIEVLCNWSNNVFYDRYGGTTLSIENKLKNAKTVTWLTDGLSERELMFIKLKSRIYIVWAIVCIHAQKLFRK